jgi:hypothetical protein
MPHDLNRTAFELATVDEWLSGDDRTLAFQVVDGDGNTLDIGNATVSWEMYDRPYHDDPADAVLDGSDSGVELVTDARVDTSAGEWEVRIDGEATDDLYGDYWHRPAVEQPDGTEATWRGKIELTA